MCCRTSKFDIEPQNTNLRPANVTSIQEKVRLNLILLVSEKFSIDGSTCVAMNSVERSRTGSPGPKHEKRSIIWLRVMGQ
jgi:hypothetical protein